MVKRAPFVFALATACVVQIHALEAQPLTGALIGTVKDAEGGVLQGAVIRVSSPAAIGGPQIMTTNAKGQRLDRRARAVPSRRGADHNGCLQSRHGWLHHHRLGDRSEKKPPTGSRHTHATHR